MTKILVIIGFLLTLGVNTNAQVGSGHSLLDWPKYENVTVIHEEDFTLAIANLRAWSPDSMLADSIMLRWWVEVEECVGDTALYEQVIWLRGDFMWDETGQLLSGAFLYPPKQIIIIHPYREVIKHEMAHVIGMTGDEILSDLRSGEK